MTWKPNRSPGKNGFSVLKLKNLNGRFTFGYKNVHRETTLRTDLLDYLDIISVCRMFLYYTLDKRAHTRAFRNKICRRYAKLVFICRIDDNILSQLFCYDDSRILILHGYLRYLVCARVLMIQKSFAQFPVTACGSYCVKINDINLPDIGAYFFALYT